MVETPFEQIKNSLIKKIPKEIINKLPDKWEKIGDVLTIVIPSDLHEYENIIGKKYAEVLNCKTVLKDVGGIIGEFRVPNVEIIYGLKNSETVHKENKVRYKLDPQKIMFSSGNMAERIRMANISNKNEIVVDLFAGIGYFTLPIAVYSKPEKIFACEKNKIAYDYLNENIVLNNVSSIVEPRMGDNKNIAPKNIANRILMGYLNETEKFITIAIDCLKNHTGIIHYHNIFSDKTDPKKSIRIVEIEAKKKGCKADVLGIFHIKSYAPGISHYVFDIKIG